MLEDNLSDYYFHTSVKAPKFSKEIPELGELDKNEATVHIPNSRIEKELISTQRTNLPVLSELQ